MSVMLSV